MMALQGFSGGMANQGFAAGQAMHVKGAFGGMLQDALAEWKKQRGEKRTQQMEIQKTGMQELIKSQFQAPTGWKPGTKEEALEYETAKKGLYPESYKEDLQRAIGAIGKTQDENKKLKIYQRISGEYPKQSSELKRILLPSQKETLSDIIRAAQGL